MCSTKTDKRIVSWDSIAGVDRGQGAQPPQWPDKKERKGVFLSDVQNVYLYSLFN